MKAHIFLIANLKFRLQTPCSFGDMAENVKLIGIPINIFLCIYIIASSPGLHTLFCLWRVNKKLPQGETSQNTFQRSRSISWKCKIHMVKWEHPPLNCFMGTTLPNLWQIGQGYLFRKYLVLGVEWYGEIWRTAKVGRNISHLVLQRTFPFSLVKRSGFSKKYHLKFWTYGVWFKIRMKLEM